MNKETSVACISIKLKEEFGILKEGKFEDKQLYDFIERAINDLKLNPSCGVKVPRNLWPKEYKKYEIISYRWLNQ